MCYYFSPLQYEHRPNGEKPEKIKSKSKKSSKKDKDSDAEEEPSAKSPKKETKRKQANQEQVQSLTEEQDDQGEDNYNAERKGWVECQLSIIILPINLCSLVYSQIRQCIWSRVRGFQSFIGHRKGLWDGGLEWGGHVLGLACGMQWWPLFFVIPVEFIVQPKYIY